MAFRTNKTPVLQEKTASGSVASFNTALAMPLSSCNIAVNAWQEGSGDPSPSNVRPIHGFSEVNVTANNAVYPIQLGQEVYGAEVDVVNGVARVGWTLFDLGNTTWTYINDFGIFQTTGTSLYIMKGIASNGVKSTMFCDTYKTYTYNQIRSDIGSVTLGIAQRVSFGIGIHDNSFNGDVEAFSNYISGHYVCFELNNPFDIQLTPTQITTIRGNNTIFADTGDVDLTYNDLDIAKRGSFREVFKLP